MLDIRVDLCYGHPEEVRLNLLCLCAARQGGIGERRPMTGLASILWRDESGVTIVEYAILLMLVAFAAVVGWPLLGNAASGSADGASNTIVSAAE